jgi:hypothetical protein
MAAALIALPYRITCDRACLANTWFKNSGLQTSASGTLSRLSVHYKNELLLYKIILLLIKIALPNSFKELASIKLAVMLGNRCKQ